MERDLATVIQISSNLLEEGYVDAAKHVLKTSIKQSRTVGVVGARPQPPAIKHDFSEDTDHQ